MLLGLSFGPEQFVVRRNLESSQISSADSPQLKSFSGRFVFPLLLLFFFFCRCVRCRKCRRCLSFQAGSVVFCVSCLKQHVSQAGQLRGGCVYVCERQREKSECVCVLNERKKPARLLAHTHTHTPTHHPLA